MPFRERVKKAFGRSDSVSDGGSLKETISRKSSNVYQPGEQYPKSKYRGPVDKKHKAKLEAFSFVDNFRRQSNASAHSPGGTRVSTRNNSYSDPVSKAHGQPSRIGQIVQNEDDTDATTNVVNLKRDSSDVSPNSDDQDTLYGVDPVDGLQRTDTAPDHQTFSQSDFEQAFNKTRLQTPTSRPVATAA